MTALNTVMVKILGCDPASCFGWAAIDSGTYVNGGAMEFSHPTPAAIRKGKHRGKKWGEFVYWFDELVKLNQPDIIVYERVRRNASTLAAHAYGFFRYSIEASAYHHNIPIYPMDVGYWKKHITEAGNATKDHVAADIHIAYPDVEFVTTDHSDALSIAHTAYLLHQTDVSLLESMWSSNGGKKKKVK